MILLDAQLAVKFHFAFFPRRLSDAPPPNALVKSVIARVSHEPRHLPGIRKYVIHCFLQLIRGYLFSLTSVRSSLLSS